MEPRCGWSFGWHRSRNKKLCDVNKLTRPIVILYMVFIGRWVV